MQADLLRRKFLDFFKAKKHKVVESDSLVPGGDPTVLFTPAGMNQFKKEFIGFDPGFKRAATCQRCLRTDDLDKVGKTSGHHTFFEMLGNFSFGDYFKKEAIGWAWEFLTEELKIKKERLWVSVYKEDAEAYGIWRDTIKIPANKIMKFGDKENFWPSEAKQRGPNGPCGPCSEIFYDQGSDAGCGKADCTPACDCSRFVEVWNLVFTQFNRKEGGVLERLAKKNIDTGMGLERLAAVMQGVPSNFETDLFKPIVKEVVSSVKCQVSSENRGLINAIADHIRAVTFAIYDGVLPSNDGRGYVVRKIIRKGLLHLKELGIDEPFLYRLAPVVSAIMKEPYPELDSRRENIAEIILSEEKNFISILNSTDKIEKEENAPVFDMAKNDPFGPNGLIFASASTSAAAGNIAFRLYDTYGIPLELTHDWWNETKKIIFIENSYTDAINKALEEQKRRSKLQSSMKGDVFGVKEMDFKVKETRFLGYESFCAKAKILKLFKDNSEAKAINKGDEATIILDKTPFYPESGGQVGDVGRIIKGKSIFEVSGTKKIGKVIAHIGTVRQGSFKNQALVAAEIDSERRLALARNHTATHLLQAALRKVLGGHVKQQGSLVAEDRLRFDFTHFKDLSPDELNRVEEIVNGYIIDSYELTKKEMKLAEAKRAGALAFFGEKYEDKVRVVSIGDFSQELCAGTHLDTTGQIGLFKILQEGSVASGVRRIEAVTGTYAYKAVKKEEDILSQAASAFNVNKENILQAIQMNLSRVKTLEKELGRLKMESVKSSLDSLIGSAQVIKGVKLITNVLPDADMDLLRKNVDILKQKTSNAVIALGAKNEGRALLVIGVTDELCGKGLDASKFVRDISALIGGSGGGRKDFAQAGGNAPENLEKAFEELKSKLSEAL